MPEKHEREINLFYNDIKNLLKIASKKIGKGRVADIVRDYGFGERNEEEIYC